MIQQSTQQLVFATLLLLQAPICSIAQTSDPSEPNRHLDAIRTFADNVLKYDRDTYGPKHMPSTAYPSLGRPIGRL